MEIRPIFSALMRNKTGLVLIALQVAITLAIVTNSLFIIKERIELMNRPSGIDEAGLFTVSSLPFAPGFDRAGSITQDLATLRARRLLAAFGSPEAVIAALDGVAFADLRPAPRSGGAQVASWARLKPSSAGAPWSAGGGRSRSSGRASRATRPR